MNVKELREFLETCDDDMVVLVPSVTLGGTSFYRKIIEADGDNHMFMPFTEEEGFLMLRELNDRLRSAGLDEDDVFYSHKELADKAEPAIILIPSEDMCV